MSEKKLRSRTLSVSDDEWNRLVALAAVEQRTVTRQVMHMTEARIADLCADEGVHARFEAELEPDHAESL